MQSSILTTSRLRKREHLIALIFHGSPPQVAALEQCLQVDLKKEVTTNLKMMTDDEGSLFVDIPSGVNNESAVENKSLETVPVER